MIMNGEEVRIWKEAILAYLRQQSRLSTGDNEENNKMPHSG
jgi:hypothetical protein